MGRRAGSAVELREGAVRKRDELPAIELAYDFLLAGNEAEAARVLRRVLDWQKVREPQLVATERRAVIARRLGGFAERLEERKAARKLAGVRARTKFRANPFPVGTVAARQFAET